MREADREIVRYSRAFYPAWDDAYAEELRRAFEEIRQLRDRLEVDNTYMREQLQLDSGVEGFVAASDVMRYVVSKVHQVAPTSSTSSP